MFFLDNLRAFVVVLVIVLHGSMSYMAYAPTWWYVLDKQNSLLFTMLVLLVDVPIMPILFFIAGYFALPSLQKRGATAFVKEKFTRVGLPWIFGALFLAPLTAYMIYVSRQVSMGYLQFWTTDFWGDLYQQSVYWFLGVLLLLFAGLAALYKWEPSLQGIPRRAQIPHWTLFVKFWAYMTLWFFVAGTVAPVDTWLNALKVIAYQPARLLLYGGYFVLGIIADRRGWFRADGFRPDPGWWGMAAFMSGMAYVGVQLGTTGGGLLLLAIEAALFNAFCLAALMAATALFQQYVNRPTRAWSSLGRNAYAIYYVHPLILYPATYAALAIGAPIFLEVAALTVFTALAAWVVGALVLTRLPLLRRIF